MNDSKSLSVSKLLELTYQALITRHSPVIIPIPGHALTEIADDTDHHRSKRGYMRYGEAGLFEIEGHTWVIGRGTSFGDYPARDFDSDILAINFDQHMHELPIAETIEYLIRRQSDHFKNSLFCGLSDGNLAGILLGYNESDKFELLTPKLGEYVAQYPIRDQRYLDTCNLRNHILVEAAKYRPKLVKVLADSIEQTLITRGKENKLITE